MNKLELKNFDIQEEVRRVAVEICNDGLEELILHTNPDEIVIHNTRKRIKFLRALLRFVKYELDKVHFVSQNNFLRHIKNLSTNQREIIVLEKAILQLLSTSSRVSTIIFLQKVHACALKEKEIIDREPTHEELVARYKKLLLVYRNLIREWLFKQRDLRHLISGITVLYDSARRLLAQAKSDREVHTLHDLRKRTKDLYHIFSVLIPASPREYRHKASALKRLSDVLGDIHDLYQIPIFLNKAAGNEAGDPVFRKIIRRIEGKMGSRTNKALKLAEELYHVTPYKFRINLARRLTRFSAKKFKPDFNRS